MAEFLDAIDTLLVSLTTFDVTFVSPAIIVVVAIIILVTFLDKCLLIVKQNEAVVIENLGKFNRLQHSGVTFLIPFYQNAREVYWRFRNAESGTFIGITGHKIPLNELRFDPEPLSCVTADNFQIDVDLVVSFNVNAVVAAAYMSSDPLSRMEDDIEACVYELIRTFQLETITPAIITNAINLNQLNARFKDTGLVVTRVFVQSITLPEGSEKLLLKIAEETLEQKANIKKIEFERSMTIAQQQSKLEELRGKQELEMAQLKHQNQIETEKAVAQKALNRLVLDIERERSSMMSEYPELLPYYELQEHTKALTALGQSGSGKKVIVLPLEGMNGMASLPVVRELLADRPRTRSPRRPRPSDKPN